MIEKIYCIDCTYFNNYNMPWFKHEPDMKEIEKDSECLSPQNQEIAIENWLLKKMKPMMKPNEINANNDCCFFIKKT